MSQPPVIFISHTTRDNRDFALAHKLARGLRERGAQVWIAPESIPAGNDWQEDIVKGVLDQCTHFLVILSAAAIKAKWVQAEIGLAEKRAKSDAAFRVLPLVVGTLGQHAHQRFLRALQQVPYHDDLHAQIDAVAEAIGLRPAVPDYALAFMSEKTRDFVGRGYVFKRIDKFMRENPNGYLTIEGDPGVGKSAILATLVQRVGCIAHFNIRAQGITTPRQFLESTCTQLIARFGLPHVTLPADATQDGRFLTVLLEEAAGQLQKSDRLLIAVDALDEVEEIPKSGNLLFLPQTLPPHVYFVMTRRRIALPLVIQTPQELVDLMAYKDEGLRDTRRYIQIQVERRPELRAWISAAGLKRSVFVKRLSDLSEGNFMYLRHVIPEIAKGGYVSLDIEHLPRGLQGYYEDHWRRMGMTERPIPRAKIQIVYILSEVKMPVSRQLLARLASSKSQPIDELQVQEALDEWEPFIREHVEGGVKLYSIYHASFQDFLRRHDIVQAAGQTLQAVHAAIADNLWSDLFHFPD